VLSGLSLGCFSCPNPPPPLLHARPTQRDACVCNVAVVVDCTSFFSPAFSVGTCTVLCAPLGAQLWRNDLSLREGRAFFQMERN
jgi:hypothetical protein